MVINISQFLVTWLVIRVPRQSTNICMCTLNHLCKVSVSGENSVLNEISNCHHLFLFLPKNKMMYYQCIYTCRFDSGRKWRMSISVCPYWFSMFIKLDLSLSLNKPTDMWVLIFHTIHMFNVNHINSTVIIVCSSLIWSSWLTLC